MFRMGVKSDSFTYPFVLKACGRVSSQKREDEEKGVFGILVWKKGSEVHCRAFKEGFCFGDFVQNSLIYMYGQCGLIDFARLVFDKMAERTVASWNTMISVYDGINDFKSANFLFESSPEKNVVSWNALIGRLVKVGDIGAASRVFVEMPERDVVSWNSMISGYVQSKDYKRALDLFREMQISGVEVTEVTLTSVLGACAETGDLMIGREIHEFLKQKQLTIEGYLGNALVDMYAKCGSLNTARKVFDGMRMRHVSCWNSMIMGLAVHGYSKEALELFCRMEKKSEEAIPNRITFIGILIACSHKGLVKEGYYYFCRMTDKYSISPDLKHYGCMVDLLSRWGKLDEAHHVIKTMPFDGNCVLWRTLLGACRIYGNVELAEEAFQKIVELEPPKDGDCVLLSNIYAELERWEDVERVRNIMTNLGVSKKPGSSQVDVK
ncbi:Pentatricopeptide repeat-containing protein [Thalictrum thalictroides]|uniref:Pentatricopeptide repeat-containing protein n=1 Tax=Thalictrum thalictroides TaxID=46969 RepID=A0A7J6XEJ9_THATH|nr:Pentatricopeptide repeat-containing protein [Thalictrum thalictroides]